MKKRILNLNRNAITHDDVQLCQAYSKELLNLVMKVLQANLNEIRDVLGVTFEQFSVLCDIPITDLKTFEEGSEEIQLNECLVICSVLDYKSLEEPMLRSILASIFQKNEIDGITLTPLNNSYTARLHNLILKGNIAKYKRKKDYFLDPVYDVAIPYEHLKEQDFNYLCDHTIFNSDVYLNAIDGLKDYFISQNKKLILPTRAFEKLEQQILSNDYETNEKAFIALNNIIRYMRLGILEIKGEKEDPNLIETMVGVLKKFSSYEDTNICLISKNERLHKSLIKELTSFKNRSIICIYEVCDNIFLESIVFEPEDTKNSYLYGYIAKWAELEGDKDNINYQRHSNWDSL